MRQSNELLDTDFINLPDSESSEETSVLSDENLISELIDIIPEIGTRENLAVFITRVTDWALHAPRDASKVILPIPSEEKDSLSAKMRNLSDDAKRNLRHLFNALSLISREMADSKKNIDAEASAISKALENFYAHLLEPNERLDSPLLEEHLERQMKIVAYQAIFDVLAARMGAPVAARLSQMANLVTMIPHVYEVIGGSETSLFMSILQNNEDNFESLTDLQQVIERQRIDEDDDMPEPEDHSHIKALMRLDVSMSLERDSKTSKDKMRSLRDKIREAGSHDNHALSLETKLKYDLIATTDVWKQAVNIRLDEQLVKMIAVSSFAEVVFVNLIVNFKCNDQLTRELYQALSTWQTGRNILQFEQAVFAACDRANQTMPIPSGYLQNLSFLLSIMKLERKTLDLRERNESAAADSSARLTENLLSHFCQFQHSVSDNPNNATGFYKAFKSSCRAAIAEEEPELATHRGYNELLGSVALELLDNEALTIDDNPAYSLETKLKHGLIATTDLWKQAVNIRLDEQLVKMIAVSSFAEVVFVNLIVNFKCNDQLTRELYQALSTWQTGRNILQFEQAVFAACGRANQTMPIPSGYLQNLSFLLSIMKLERKTLDLQERNESAAADSSARLTENLLSHFCQFQRSVSYNPNNATGFYKAFKSNCRAAITAEKPELAKHRGYKEILGNMALAIAGLGLFYLAAASFNYLKTGNFFFFRTDSEKFVDDTNDAVNRMKPSK